MADNAGSAVTLHLLSDDATRTRFAAWWRGTHGAQSITNATVLPPNTEIIVPNALVQVTFPKLDGTGGDHELDFPFKLNVQTFASLVDTQGGGKEIKLTDWNLTISPIGDPLDPDNPVWGGAPPQCVDEIKRLRLIIRDLFIMGTNVALTNLGKTLAKSLPLPPIDIINGISLTIRDLFIQGHTIAVDANIAAGDVQHRVRAAFLSEITRFQHELEGLDLNEILNNGRLLRGSEYEEYLVHNIPAYAGIAERFARLQRRAVETTRVPKAAGARTHQLRIRARTYL